MKVKLSQEVEAALKAMSERLELIRIELKQNKAQFANELGYKNPSPLTRIGKTSGFIGPAKLQKLATLRAPNGNVPNINWLLTGTGPILMKSDEYWIDEKKNELLTKEQIAAVIAETLDYETLHLLATKLKLLKH